MEKQLLNRLDKAEQRITDLYAKIRKVQSGTYSREIITLPVPELDSTVTVNITALDTVIVFEGDILVNFYFEVIVGPNVSQGDRIYFMAKGNSDVEISLSSNLNPVTCGDSSNIIAIQENMICHEMIFDGAQFTGIDIC